MQEKGEFIFPEDLSEKIKDLYIDFDFNQRHEKIAEVLRDTGLYKAEVIYFNDKYYSKKDLDKIASFAFSPKMINQEKYNGKFRQNIKNKEIVIS